MLEKLEELKNVMKTLEKTKKDIENKYNQLEEIKKIDDRINEKDNVLKPLDLHIERLKEELTEVNPKDAMLIAEYEKQIKESLNSTERQGILADKDKLLKDKEEMLKQISENKLDNERKKKIELRQADDSARKTLTQEKMKLEREIEQIDVDMKQQLVAMQNFKYEYEEKDGVRIATNGMEMKAINDKYAELTDKKREIQEALKYCEEMLADFRRKDEEEVAKMSKAWNEAWREEKQNPEQEKLQSEPIKETSSETPEAEILETTPGATTTEAETPKTTLGATTTEAETPKTTPGATTTEAEKGESIKRIELNISKEGTQIVVSKEGKIIDNKGKLSKLTEKIGTQDEMIRTEINKAVADGLLTIDEAKKEIELYEQFVQSDDQKEKETIKDKMKLRLNYDLSGMIRAKIPPKNRSQLRTNAAETLELGIGDVQPKWMKAFVKLESDWKKTKAAKWIKGIGDKIAGYLPLGKGEENEPVRPDVGETVKNTGKTDRLGYSLEKTPAEIETEKTAEEIGKIVEEIENENGTR